MSMTESTSGYAQVITSDPLPVEYVTFKSTNTFPGTIWISAEDVDKKPMTESKLLEELAKELALPNIEADEVTAQMVAVYTGISWSQAMRTLRAKEAAGALKSRKVKLPNNRVAMAWRKA